MTPLEKRYSDKLNDYHRYCNIWQEYLTTLKHDVLDDEERADYKKRAQLWRKKSRKLLLDLEALHRALDEEQRKGSGAA